MRLSSYSNIAMILQILFTKIEKYQLRAAATLAPTGNKAMQAGYNTKILKELLLHWHDHLDHLEPSNMTFMPYIAITDTDTKE